MVEIDEARLGDRRSRGRARRQLLAGAKPDEVVDAQRRVKIVGYLNVAGRLAGDASALYAKNLATFLDLMIEKDGRRSRSTRTTNRQGHA